MFEPLPALVRQQRLRQGLTIDGLAALAGVSRSRLIALEKGRQNVSLELVVKIANALHMKELHVCGLLVSRTTPEFNVMVAAAEAIQAAESVVDRAAEARKELARVTGRVSALLSSTIATAEKSRRPAGAEETPPADSDERDNGTG